MIALRLAVIAGSIVFGIWLMIGAIRKGLVPWHTVIRVAAPAAILVAIGPLLSLPLLLKNYNTAIPLPTFEALSYTSVAVSVVLTFVVLAAAVAFVLSFYPQSAAAFRAANRHRLTLDALVAVLAAAGLAFALSQAEDWLTAHFHKQALYSIAVSNDVASAAPAVAAISGAVRTVLLSAATLALLALIMQRAPRRWMLLLLGLVALTVNLPSSVRTGGEFTLAYGLSLLSGIAALLFCRVFARSNHLAYALVFWILALRPAAADLLATGNPALEVHGGAIVFVMILSAAWLWIGSRGSAKATP